MIEQNKNTDLISNQYLVLNIGPHYFAVNVQNIEDVMKGGKTTPVPLSKNNINGLLNLRGHIVTEINVAKTLNINSPSENTVFFNVVINVKNEFYSLSFEGIGDVINILPDDIQNLPETVQKEWRYITKGVHRLPEHILVILDLNLLIETITKKDNFNSSDAA